MVFTYVTIFPYETSFLASYVCLKSLCECIHVARFFPSFSTRENPGFVELETLTLVEGEKMRCEVILRRNKIRGEITEHYFYHNLSLYVT